MADDLGPGEAVHHSAGNEADQVHLARVGEGQGRVGEVFALGIQFLVDDVGGGGGGGGVDAI